MRFLILKKSLRKKKRENLVRKKRSPERLEIGGTFQILWILNKEFTFSIFQCWDLSSLFLFRLTLMLPIRSFGMLFRKQLLFNKNQYNTKRDCLLNKLRIKKRIRRKLILKSYKKKSYFKSLLLMQQKMTKILIQSSQITKEETNKYKNRIKYNFLILLRKLKTLGIR